MYRKRTQNWNAYNRSKDSYNTQLVSRENKKGSINCEIWFRINDMLKDLNGNFTAVVLVILLCLFLLIEKKERRARKNLKQKNKQHSGDTKIENADWCIVKEQRTQSLLTLLSHLITQV